MKLLLDFLPIALFFITYKLTNSIIEATLVLIPATLCLVLLTWLIYKKIERMHIVTLIIVIILGGATVLLQDKRFIEWKPTVVNWLFAAAFLVSPLWGKGEHRGKYLIQRMLEKNIELPKSAWRNLNKIWIAFFLLMGAINIVVFSYFSEATWVNFKLFGMLGLTFIFIILQSIYMARQAQLQEVIDRDSSKKSINHSSADNGDL